MDGRVSNFFWGEHKLEKPHNLYQDPTKLWNRFPLKKTINKQFGGSFNPQNHHLSAALNGTQHTQ